jgi:hypothetical protein
MDLLVPSSSPAAPAAMSSSSAMEKASSSSGKEGPFCSILAEIYGMIFFST